jgi:hypothetical protein
VWVQRRLYLTLAIMTFERAHCWVVTKEVFSAWFRCECRTNQDEDDLLWEGLTALATGSWTP